MGAFTQFHTLESVNFFVALLASVLVIAVQRFWLKIVFDRHLQRRVDHAGAELVLDRELDVKELLLVVGLIGALFTRNEGGENTLIEISCQSVLFPSDFE